MELHTFDILMVSAPLYSLVVHIDEVSAVVCIDNMKLTPFEFMIISLISSSYRVLLPLLVSKGEHCELCFKMLSFGI